MSIRPMHGSISRSAAAATLTARYSFSDRRFFDPFAGPAFALIPGFGTDVPRRGQNLATTFTHAPTSKLVNDVRFGYNRVSIGVFAENTAVSNASVGVPALTSNPRDAGLSVISVAGFSSLGHEYTTPQESTSDTFQLSDTATWARGTHLAKFGGEWYGVRQRAYRDVQARGFLNFVSQGYTGNALADLLMGLPVLTGGARLDNPQNLRAQSWSLFAHDDWRATPALTISAGVRYEYASPPVDADDRANLYDPATGQLVPVGTGNMPRGGYEPDRNNVAPRAGFAWAMDPESAQDPPRRLRHLLQPGSAGHVRRAVLQPSVLQPERVLSWRRDPGHARRSVPGVVPGVHSTVGDRVPAGPADAVDGALERQRAAPDWAEPGDRDRLRRLPRPRSDLGARHEPGLRGRQAEPLFADITLIESRGTSRYNALQVRYQQRPAHGMSVHMAYTLGKSTDDASGFFTSAGDPNFPQNSLDPAAERGPSSFDIRHRFTAGAIMPVPFGTGQPMLANQGWLSKALADMEVRLVFTFQTGRPFTVALLPDVDNSNTGRSNLGFGFNDRPNVNGDTSLDEGTADEWFETVGVLDARVRDVRQQRTECLPGARVFEPQRRAGKADPLWTDDHRRAPARSVQPAQPDQLRSARRVLRIADLRPDPLGAGSSAVSDWNTGGVLNGGPFLVLSS